MIPWLEHLKHFPSSENALTQDDGADGLLCASQSIDASMLKQSYPHGIYPWYGAEDPVMWWTPSKRAILRCDAFKTSKSLRKTIGKWQSSGQYSVRVDTAFEQVLACCADRPQGTWMSMPLRRAYTDWHHEGAVHSIEVWRDGQLIGGFYGVCLGQMFFGESMFSRETDASKVALACFIQWFSAQGGDMIDCQQDTAHLQSLGASTIARAEFEREIALRIRQPSMDWLSVRALDLLENRALT